MQDAAQAYGQTAKITQSPRDLEASLLFKAAAQLKNIQDNWEEHSTGLYDALLYNRKLWTILVSSAISDENELPIEIKNNIGTLGIFVFNHTVEVQENPAPEQLTTLININCELAAGLNSDLA